MKIREISFKNCLSFSNKGLNEENRIQLSDFNLFIGSNNAGKSNVLKLIEMVKRILQVVRDTREPSLANMQVSLEGQAEDWVFGQNLENKIEFSFSLEIEERDKDSLNITPYNHRDKNPVLFLLDRKEHWPKIITVAGVIKYTGDSPRAVINKIEIPNDRRPYSDVPVLFDREKKILALREDSPSITEVWKVVSYSDEGQWKNDYSLVGNSIRNFLTQIYDKVFVNLFINIRAIREIKFTGDEVSEKLANFKEGRPNERIMFNSVQRFVSGLIFNGEGQGVELRFPGTSANKRVEVAVGNLVLPLSHYGSSVEQMLALAARIVLQGADKVILIEEPEAHFHPDLQRKFVKFLRENQTTFRHQYLIATHSNVFINEFVNMERNVYFVYTQPGEGDMPKYSQVNTFNKEGSKVLFTQLGIRPSDLFFANGVLVVEGITDKDVYTDWAGKIGRAFKIAGIEIIDVEGAGNISKYLGSEIIQHSCFGCYGLCDKNAEKEVRQKLTGIVSDENIIILTKGDLEDYYPRELVLQFANEWAKYRGKKQEEIPSEIKEGETVKKLDKLLGKDTGWKRRLADKVIEEMKPEQIDDEIRGRLTQIYDSIWKSLAPEAKIEVIGGRGN